ncbi:MAG: aryl-sulfate sulfotransferase, partial [Candidatus Hodarchaeota archaeon]
MRKSRIIIIGISVIIVIIGIPAAFIISNILKMGERAQPFSLDNAPEHIVEDKTVLKEKLENGTFSLEADKESFLAFTNWMADNSPDILDLIENWDQVVFFEVENSTSNMWWIIGNNSAIVEVGTNPPEDYGILIELTFEAFTAILKQEETPLSAFQKGLLRYEGPFDEVLKVSQIVLIVSATVMDKNIPVTFGGPFLDVTSDETDLYIEGGLTLLPVFEVIIYPDHIGEHHRATLGLGSVIIVNSKGKIIAKLENSGHTVHKFINSTTVMMGGQEGFMELWNYKNDILERLPVPGGHHDFDYNPETKTSMMLEYAFSNEMWDGKNVIYDLLSEYNWNGDLVWQWDPRIFFPFNSSRHVSLGLNESFRGGADWMHANSFVWDKSDKVIYLNVRSQDTILKINYTNKEVIWDAGRNGDFTLLNAAGKEVNSLFSHSHGLERVSSNRFIMYDNDLYNQSNPSTMTLENSSGHSRFLELEIDEENRIMREIWSWIPKNQSYYFPESGGDADRLPNGNTLGIFGDKGLVLNVRDPVIITEVTNDGKIAWELQIPGFNETYYWIQEVERFYERPLISIHNQSLDLNERFLQINVSVWDVFRHEATSSGILRIIANNQEIYQESFEFLPQWQPKTFEITVNSLPNSVNSIELIIENSDEIKNTVVIYKKPGDVLSQFGSILLLLGGFMVAMPVILVIWKKTRNKSVY